MNELTSPQARTSQTEGSESYYSGSAESQGPFAQYYGYHGVQREHPLRQYVGVILRHWILICGLGIIGLAWGARLNALTPRSFQSTALIKIGSYIPPEDGPTADLLRDTTSGSLYTSSQIPLLKSRLIAKQVLTTRPDVLRILNPALARHPGDRAGPQPRIPLTMIDQYLGLISFSVMDETSLVRISATASGPAAAARLANAHAEAFIDLVREQLRETASVNLGYLKRRVDDIAQKLEAKNLELKEFSANNAINFSGSSGIELMGEKSRFLLTSLSETVQDRAGVEGELRELQSISFEREPPAAMQPVFIRLNAARSEYDALAKSWPYHPTLRLLKNEIKTLRATLRQAGKSALRESTVKYRAISEKERLLREEFKQLKNSEASETAKYLEYQLLESERDALRDVAKDVRRRLDDAVITAGTDQQTVKMIDPAVPSQAPINLREKSNLMTGGLFGLLLGLTVAFFLAVSNNAVLTVADLKRLTNLTVLGVVPSFGKRLLQPYPSVLGGSDGEERSFRNESALARVIASGERTRAATPPHEDDEEYEDESDVDPNRLVLVSAPLSRESESFRHVRTTLKLSQESGPPKTILVTSGQKNDGKTTVAANLAVSFAQSASRVVLIDADLRLPSVFRYFGQPRHALGLRDYLAGECELESILIDSGIDNLQLILSGGSTTGPAELLSGPKMVELMETLSARFDHLVIDSPPVAHVTDALLLSPYANAVALVVRSGQTPKPVAEFAVHRLRQVHANLIGAVLNDVKRSASYREPEYYFVRGKYYYG